MAKKLDFSGTSGKMANNVIGKAEEFEGEGKKKNVDISLIDNNPDNERLFGYNEEELEALEAIIKENGFKGAIECWEKPDGRYEVSSGHRRLMVAKKLGYTTIPVIINKMPDEASVAKALITSNTMHRTLTPYNYAQTIQYYEEKVLKASKKAGRPGRDDERPYEGRARDEIARVFNISASSVQRYKVLLKLKCKELIDLANEKDYPYINLLSIASLDAKEQEEMYKRLVEIAPDGDISKVSARLVDVEIERYKGAEERKKQKAEEKSAQKESKRVEESNFDAEYNVEDEGNDSEPVKVNIPDERLVPKYEEIEMPQADFMPTFETNPEGEMEKAVESLRHYILTKEYVDSPDVIEECRELIKIIENGLK